MKQFTRAVVSAALCAALSLACTLPAYAAEGEMLEVNEDISVSADYDWTRFANDHLTLNVYNWGLYISDGSDDSVNVISAFEDLTGIKVNYTTFDSNESLYAKMKSGGASYDVIVPSEYMVGKMIAENMLAELDYDNIPNMANIGENYLGWSYDPDNTYSVPYTWGTTLGELLTCPKTAPTIMQLLAPLAQSAGTDGLDEDKGQPARSFCQKVRFPAGFCVVSQDCNGFSGVKMRIAGCTVAHTAA